MIDALRGGATQHRGKFWLINQHMWPQSAWDCRLGPNQLSEKDPSNLAEGLGCSSSVRRTRPTKPLPGRAGESSQISSVQISTEGLRPGPSSGRDVLLVPV